jgi:hypothetical protein
VGVVTGDDSQRNDTYLSDVLLLCVECQQPIKARINTPYWLRVEWIGPAGECQVCNNKQKDEHNGRKSTTGTGN